MRGVRLLLWPAGAALGIAAEWSFRLERPGRLAAGPRGRLDPDRVRARGWSQRPESHSGPLMAATGFAWFAANFTTTGLSAFDWFGDQALYLHRGPLVHLVLSYPPAGSAAASTARRRARIRGSDLPAVWRSETGHVRARRPARRRCGAWLTPGRSAASAAPVLPRSRRRPSSPPLSPQPRRAARRSDQRAADATLLAYRGGALRAGGQPPRGLVLAPWDRAQVTDLVVDSARQDRARCATRSRERSAIPRSRSATGSRPRRLRRRSRACARHLLAEARTAASPPSSGTGSRRGAGARLRPCSTTARSSTPSRPRRDLPPRTRGCRRRSAPRLPS